ncbi:MAG: hypothetical protein ACUVTM_03000 [Candidatus Bathyarchaeia archaeon]
MGVHRVTSEAAKAYAARERALGNGIAILGAVAENIKKMDKKTLEKCGDLAAEMLPYSPGYVGKTILIIARLFWAMASAPEKETKVIPLEQLEAEIDEIRQAIPT